MNISMGRCHTLAIIAPRLVNPPKCNWLEYDIIILFIYRARADVYAWGDNRFGQCGTGSEQTRYSLPTKVPFFKSKSNITSLEASDYTSCAIVNKKAYVWGAWYNSGQKMKRYRLEPEMIEDLKKENVVLLKMSTRHSIAVCEKEVEKVFPKDNSKWLNQYQNDGI